MCATAAAAAVNYLFTFFIAEVDVVLIQLPSFYLLCKRNGWLFRLSLLDSRNVYVQLGVWLAGRLLARSFSQSIGLSDSPAVILS